MKFAPTHISDFDADILVRCPQCERCAHLLAVKTETWPGRSRRLTCGHCGHCRDWDNWSSPNADWQLGFGLEVWHKTSCCGEVLWAYNADHLAHLEKYIGAELRECLPDPERGHVNQSIESRLPKWMVLGKNRSSVLEGLATLRAMLPQTSG